MVFRNILSFDCIPATRSKIFWILCGFFIKLTACNLEKVDGFVVCDIGSDVGCDTTDDRTELSLGGETVMFCVKEFESQDVNFAICIGSVRSCDTGLSRSIDENVGCDPGCDTVWCSISIEADKGNINGCGTDLSGLIETDVGNDNACATGLSK